MSLPKNRWLLFLCLFFLSGAAGLIYEISWSRMLVLVFGGTTFAITTVLCCFMGGLALGSYLAGRVASRLAHPLRWYGWLEIGIGLFCLSVPLLFRLANPLYRVLAPHTGESFVLLTAVRVVVSSSILLVPTCMMGATLPILVQAFVRSRDDLGGRIAGLYGVNTAGAFIGCVAAGFFLVPTAGLSGSIWVAAAINIGVGFGALASSRAPAVEAEPKLEEKPSAEHPPLSGTEGPTLPAPALLVLYAVSGFAAMAYQVAWTRALILAMGSSTYAFSSIVACYILGLAAGSLLFSWAESRPALHGLLGRKTLEIAGWLQAGIALSALLVTPLFGRMPVWVAQMARQPGATFSQVLWAETLIVLGLLFVPTLCMGALMPMVCRLYARESGAGRSVGDVYASNTAGTIVGAFAAGFVLIPLESIGMQRTIYIASVLSAGIGGVFVLAGSKRSVRAWAGLGAVGAVGIATVALTAPWSREVMVSGPYLARDEPQQSVLYYREGVDTTVAVTSTGGAARTLRVNGKPDASTSYKDVVTQLMTAHIPMLLRPDADDVLVIGLGSGATAGAVLNYPVSRVEVAEISAAVVESAAFFDAVNNGVREDPRVTTYRADGRNHLLLTDRRYDLIISEPSNPWISGVANLFTKEFFELARGRLRKGGLHCQWIQGYSIAAEDVAAVLNTLGSVFPETQMWELNFGGYLIIGSEDVIELDLDRIYELMGRPAIAQSLAMALIQDPNQIAAHWIAGRGDLEGWASSRRILTDDRPYLEFAAPRFLLRSDEARIREVLLSFERSPEMAAVATPELVGEFGQALENSRQRRRVMQRLESAVQAKDAGALLDNLVDLTRWGSTDGRTMAVAHRLLSTVESIPNPSLERRVRTTGEQLRRESPYLAMLGSRDPRTSALPWPLGRDFAHDGDPEVQRLETEIRQAIADGDQAAVLEGASRLLERAPESWRGLATLGALLLNSEGPQRARPYLLKAWVRNPGSRAISHRLAQAYARLNELELALAFLRDAIDGGLPVGTVAADPALAPLREHPEVQGMLTR